jgi:hypothetical protein
LRYRPTTPQCRAETSFVLVKPTGKKRVPDGAARSVQDMDKPLFFILVALALTLLLFAMDVFPYPFGLIVLTLLALGRFLQIKGPA